MSSEPREPAQERSRRRASPLVIVFALATLVSLAAFAVAAWSVSRVSTLETQVADLQHAQDQVKAALTASGATNGSLVDEVKTLQTDVADAQQAADDAASTADDATSAIDDLTTCVNDYMKVVGDAGGGRYRYQFC
jgi:septal ring factor EnvC (AmiA/AmiB activator)